MVLPFLFVLAAVGAQVLWARRERLARVAAVVTFGIVGLFAADAVGDRVTLQPTGYAAVGEVLEAEGFADRAVYVFGSPHLQRYYLGDRVVGGVSGDPIPVGAVVVTEQNWNCVSRFSVTALCCGGLAVSSCRWLRRVTVVQLGPVTLWLP